MNKDIRLKVTFPNHKKTIKLIHLIGFEGFYSLVHLWCYVAQNHPKGVLKDYDKDDLEIAARWSGDRGAFAKAVNKKEINFVKKTAKGFEINDWEEHNPYVFHADERSEKARAAAKARWKPTDSKGSGDASSIDIALPLASVSNAPSPGPSPLPPPPPKPKHIWILPEGIKPEVWQEYEDHRKTTKTKLTDAARTKNANVLLKNLSDQQEIIDTAIGSGWTGLFPLKKNSKTGGNRGENRGARKPEAGKYDHLDK